MEQTGGNNGGEKHSSEFEYELLKEKERNNNLIAMLNEKVTKLENLGVKEPAEEDGKVHDNNNLSN